MKWELIPYELAKTKKLSEEIKAEYILDEYPLFLKEKGLKDNATMRNAFLHKQEKFLGCVDRVDFLIAVEKLIEGKIKVLNNVARIMKKEMDSQIRSAFNGNKFVGR